MEEVCARSAKAGTVRITGLHVPDYGSGYRSLRENGCFLLTQSDQAAMSGFVNRFGTGCAGQCPHGTCHVHFNGSGAELQHHGQFLL